LVIFKVNIENYIEIAGVLVAKGLWWRVDGDKKFVNLLLARILW